MKKNIMAILTATAILLSLLGPTLYKPVTAADPEPWYTTMNGVLTSDTYLLYPYEYNSLDFGISKFGEMIDATDGLPDVGLQYPGYEVVETYDQTDGTSRDPFANEGISRNLWLNGWLLEARYTHRTRRDRRVLAMAMFADMTSYGGDWLNGHSSTLEDSPFGGRKTTGYAETEPLQVLYNGPREYIALSVTHLYDWEDGNEDGVVDHPAETWQILDLKLTFIFNKVKKEVIILKDVKIVITGKALDSPLDIQFSNREEWDLGPYPDWDSYAHFYHQELETCYGPDWHLAPGIMREYIYKGVGPIVGVSVWSEPYGPPIATGSVRVYVNGDFKEEGEDYDINYDTGDISWHISVAYTDEVEVVYKLWKYDVEEGLDASVTKTALDGFPGEAYDGVPHLYDVAQIISSDLEYVGWKAFWPTLSDYTVDGWSQSFIPLINVNQPDIVPIEPEIPFVIGEWDFMLGKDYPSQFRGVEVLGLTDWHDADDAQLGVSNVIDREAMYQLNEVFNPWDLTSAVHKETERWVEFPPLGTTHWISTRIPVVDVADADWDQYAVFSERVIDLTTDTLLNRWEDDYTFWVDAAGYGHITGLVSTHYYKILYSTIPEPRGRYEWVTVGRDAASVDSVGAALVSEAFDSEKDIRIGIGGEDMLDPEIANWIPWVMAKFGTGDTKQDYYYNKEGLYVEDYRTALKDDWCTYWPISSSNMIGVGGPLANMLAYYGNDFTNAFFGLPDYAVDSPYSGKITGIPCWNRGWDGTWNVYESSTSVGYAVISTYLDINGTVLFLVWGHWGRDTYYATQWFHGDVARGILPGIVQLQDAPEHLTSIILEIDYEDPEHPTFSIPECLGTISEIEWIHGDETKGGIHDP